MRMNDVRQAAQVTCHLTLPQLSDGWLDLAVATGIVKQGVNRVAIAPDPPVITAASDNDQLCRDLVLRVAFPKK